MKAPWKLNQPWFTITFMLTGFLLGLVPVILIEVLT